MHGVAIIGTGNAGRTHADSFLKDSRCSLRALCSRTLSKCEDIARGLDEERRKQITITDDWHTLLDRSDIDIVSIALPPALHEEAVCAFLRKGKHVLLEKPMGITCDEDDRMLEEARRSGAKLGLVFQNRYYRNIQKVRKMLDSGCFGRILSVDVVTHWFRGSNYHDLYWRGMWGNEGGGCLISQGVHQVDMLLWFMGGLPESITAIMANQCHTNSEAEDSGAAIMRFPSSAIATFSVSLSDMDEMQSFRFQCEKAAFTIPEWSVHVKKAQPNGFPEDDREEEERLQRIFDSIATDSKEGHDAAISRFIDAVESGKDPDATGEDGRRANEFISAFYMSAATGQTVPLPLKKDAPVYTKDGLIALMPRFHRKTISTESKAGVMTLGSAAR